MNTTSKKQGPQSFTININNSADHIYAWDEQIQSLRALDDEASVLPAALKKP